MKERSKMFISSMLLVVGLLVGAIAAYVRGFRLGGVVVCPLLAVYTLRSFYLLPVFVFAGAVAYAGLHITQQRRVLYGRKLLLAAIVMGAVVPLVLFAFVSIAVGQVHSLHEVEFLGSILPGIAAYNFYRLSPERRRVDLLISTGYLSFLLLLGLVATVLWATPPCTTCQFLPRPPTTYAPQILLSDGSDIAMAVGSQYGTMPAAWGEWTTLGIVVLGLLLSEFARARWDLRLIGVIALPLLVLFALRTWWTVPLYLFTFIVSYLGITVIHRWTLLYGRALLSIAVVIGTIAGIPPVIAVSLSDGLAALFTAFLGGIGAYNLHAVAPAHRWANLIIAGGTFVIVFAVARLVIVPRPGGLTPSIDVIHMLVGGALLIASAWQIYEIERTTPSNHEIQTDS